MKDKKKSLMRELKGTIFLLSTAMLAMWFLFYAYMHNILKSYITENMEQVSAEIINELDKTFLQLEEVSFALAKDDEIISLMKSDSSLEFHNRTNEIEHILEQVIVDKSFMDNIVFLNYSGDFYRYSGNISNIGISRMTNILTKNKITKHIQLQLDDSRYIGYGGPSMSSLRTGRLETSILLVTSSTRTNSETVSMPECSGSESHSGSVSTDRMTPSPCL